MTGSAWHPVALSHDVARNTSTDTRLGGEELVVWRDGDGRIHVWPDRCPHRGMRLSFGFVRENHIACLYHGWRFDAAGQCRYIPAHPDLDVPPTIRIEPFATREQFGMVWVRLAGAGAGAGAGAQDGAGDWTTDGSGPRAAARELEDAGAKDGVGPAGTDQSAGFATEDPAVVPVRSITIGAPVDQILDALDALDAPRESVGIAPGAAGQASSGDANPAARPMRHDNLITVGTGRDRLLIGIQVLTPVRTTLHIVLAGIVKVPVTARAAGTPIAVGASEASSFAGAAEAGRLAGATEGGRVLGAAEASRIAGAAEAGSNAAAAEPSELAAAAEASRTVEAAEASRVAGAAAASRTPAAAETDNIAGAMENGRGDAVAHFLRWAIELRAAAERSGARADGLGSAVAATH